MYSWSTSQHACSRITQSQTNTNYTCQVSTSTRHTPSATLRHTAGKRGDKYQQRKKASEMKAIGQWCLGSLPYPTSLGTNGAVRKACRKPQTKTKTRCTRIEAHIKMSDPLLSSCPISPTTGVALDLFVYFVALQNKHCILVHTHKKKLNEKPTLRQAHQSPDILQHPSHIEDSK